MDRNTKLTTAIDASIDEFIADYGHPEEGIEIRRIVNEARSLFQLAVMGWQGVERIYHILFHLEIKDGKVWVQEDNTESGIASYLLKNGLSKQEIVLAFYSEKYRQHTEFAVA